MSSWSPTEKEKYGVAIYNYHGDIEHGLSLGIGDAVQIYEQCSGWYHGCLLRNRSQKGIFPVSYIFIKECEVEHAGTQYEVIIPKEDVTVKELSSVLREWSIIWKRLYLKREFQLFVALTKIMKDLIEFRQQLLNGTLTKDQAFETKQKAIIDIDWANSKMGLDLIPRINGEVLDGDNVVSVVELYNVHVESAKASESGLGTFKKVKKHPVKTMTNRMLYLTVNGLMCNLEEDCQVFFSLYDASKGEFISERYMVSVGKRGSNQKVDQLQKLTNATCVFMDLGESVIYSNCYLVAQLVRIGKMLSESSSKKVSNMSFRRPYGCSVVDIVDILKDYDEIEDSEMIMPIQLIGGSSDTDYITMHESIIKKLQSKYGVPDSNMNIQISVRMLHGDFDKLQRENPLLFPKETAIVRRLGFPDIIMPGDVRNDVYVTLERGEFERGSGKTAQRNVEVSMVVLGANGRVLEDVIYPGGGSRPCSEYNSIIYYHNGNPKWNETVKVKVPFEKFYGSIIRFGFRHLAKYEEKDKESKTFAFAFLHLMRQDGTTVRDGSHELIVYKFEKNTFYDSKAFTTLPSMQSQLGTLKNSTTERVPRTREAFYVRTVVCSTKLTQNVHLVGLLRWREQKHQLQSVLESLIKIDGEEIVKFLQDIFDALFWILNDSAEEYGSLVFQAIVFIICILSDKKYQHFQAVLTTYIEKHFSGTTAHKKLISCLKQTLEQTGNTNSIERLKKMLMALEYVFKFIIQSRVLYINTFGNKDGDKFRIDLVSLFVAMNKVMNQRSGEIVQAQSLLLRNFSGIYTDTLKLLTRVELGNIIKEFINSVGKDSKCKALICPKLQCILQTVQSELFIHEDSRKVLLPMIVSHIHFHLSQKQEMKTCAGILGPVLTVLQIKALGSKEEDIYLVVKSLLQTVFLIVRILDRAGTLSRHLLAILINLLRIMTEDHYHRFLEGFDSKKELRDFLFNAFVVFTEMIKRHIFPNDWVVIIMLANNVILTAVQNFSVALCDNFCEDNFDLQLWNTYFQLSVTFLIQPHLQLENFTEVKRNKLIDRYGDMRQVMGFEIGDMWQNLGEHKKNFISGLIGPFLEMTLVPETELRKATLPIFFDMIESELLSKGFIQTVENEIVNKLDTLVNYNKMSDDHHDRKEGPVYKKKGDEEYKELFHDILTEKVEDNLHGEYKDEGLGFVNRITELLELLLDYRSCRAENNLLRRLNCIVNLLEFYRGIYREDMYIRYINRLCELHIPAENYTEAGFTLLLHAALLTWDELPLNETKTSVTERQLKEKLYLDAIEYFDKGKCWEKGIELCKELATIYEEEMYDFIKLRDILKNEALLYDQIMTKVRPDAEYFRVAMYGRGFPASLRDKVFIFRGNEFEKMGDFNSRLQGHFPDAQFMDKLDAPDDSVLQSAGQYIQTCKVNPVFKCENRFKDRSVDERIIGYFRTNSVNSFTYNRPFHRGSKINEFADLWLERTTMTIASPLPGILKWFPVASMTTEEISPIRNAIETVEQKNRQIRSLISVLSSEPNQNINPLSMTLNGVIDAAVMGGTAKYREAFFSDGYLLSNPQDEVYVNELHQVILLQVQILEEGLELHQRLLSRPLVPFHEKMALQFAGMKADVTGEPYEKPQPILLPATPEEKKVDRKLSLTPRKASTSSRESRNSMFYDSAISSPLTPSPNAPLSKRTFSSSLTSLNSSASRGSFPSFGGSMSSLSGSILSLNTVKEEDCDEVPPPVPLKNRPPSDPDQRSFNGVPIIPLDHGRKSLPASVMSSWLGRVNGSAQLPKKGRCASPPLPKKERDMSPPLPRKERSGSSLLTSNIEDLPGIPPPLPPRQSAHYSSTSSIYSSSDDEPETPKTSPVPALPPKTRNSSHHDNQTDSKPNPLRDDYDIPIPHQNPGSSDVNTSGRVSRKFEYDIVQSPDSDTVSVFSLSSRDSITTPDELLTPVPSDISPTPTLPSKKFVYPMNNILGSPPEDTPPPLQPRAKHTIQENSKAPESRNKPVEDFFSKFRKDFDNFGNEQFPLSAPLSSWSFKTTKTVTKTTIVNGKTVSSTSSETSHSTSGGGTSTARPNSLLTSDQSLNDLMDELGSSLGRRMTSPTKVSKPVPVPRKMSGDWMSISTPTLTKREGFVEDEEERPTRPTVKPRARTPSNKDTMETPPKPPKQYSNTPPQ